MVQVSVLLLLSLAATSSGFLLEGLGLGGLGGGGRQCCCPPPPPPPPCGGGGYEAPPPPPPPPSYAMGSSYAGSYGPGPYKHRSKKSVDLKASSEDLFCNSVQVRDIIKKGMTEDETTSREAITTLLKANLERQYVVICSKTHFDYLASADSEFCSVTNDSGMTCSSFVF